MSNSIKILFLFLLFGFVAKGQNLKCAYCNKEITGKYIVVDGKAYHKNHFKCANCGMPIKGEYYKKGGKYYDEKCFEKLFMPRCAVCGKPINGEYFTDLYGMKIHKYHENQLPRCDNCNRIISERTTHGGVKYDDGRNICNLCYRKRITTETEYKKSFNKVVSVLSNYGLKFDVDNIQLKIVDLKKLQSVSGNKYSKSIQGFTKTKIEYRFGKKRFSHTVYILYGIPPKDAEATIAHELMHTWLSENIEHKLTPQLEEGSCNYVSYTYLKGDYSADARNIIKRLKQNPDKIYGEGFRKVYDRFVGRNFNLFIEYLKTHKNF